MGEFGLKTKQKVGIVGLISILVLIIAASGCTSDSNSNSDSKTYNGLVSFNYPSSWEVSLDQGDMIKLKTPNSETRIWIYNITDNPVEYENFPVTKTVGNNTYKMIPAESGSELVSYVIRKDGKDFFMIGVTGDESGHQMILTSVKL